MPSALLSFPIAPAATGHLLYVTSVLIQASPRDATAHCDNKNAILPCDLFSLHNEWTGQVYIAPDERSYLKAELFVFPTTMDCPVILSPVMFPPCLFLGTIQE